MDTTSNICAVLQIFQLNAQDLIYLRYLQDNFCKAKFDTNPRSGNCSTF